MIRHHQQLNEPSPVLVKADIADVINLLDLTGVVRWQCSTATVSQVAAACWLIVAKRACSMKGLEQLEVVASILGAIRPDIDVCKVFRAEKRMLAMTFRS